MRDHGSKRAHSHASGSLTNSASNMDKLQSAFLMGRDRGGGDETSNNVKSNKGDEASQFGEKKGSVGHSRATHSYLSNRLSRQRGGGRSIVNGTLPEAQGGDAGSIASIRSGSRKLNSQGAKRDILSQRKGSTNEEEMGGTLSDTNRMDTISRSAAKVNATYDVPPQNLSRSQKDMNRFYLTANNLYGKDKGLNKFVQDGMHSTQDDVRTIIGLALNRKQVSANYHSQAYPYFMRSQGPFKIYDHA